MLNLIREVLGFVGVFLWFIAVFCFGMFLRKNYGWGFSEEDSKPSKESATKWLVAFLLLVLAGIALVMIGVLPPT